MQTVLIIGANGKVSIEATKLFLEDSNFNVDLFLRNAHRIPDYASNRVTVYEGDAKNSKDLEQAIKLMLYLLVYLDLDIEAQAIVDAMSKKMLND